MDQAFDYIWDDQGIESEKDYPYLGQDGSCNAQPSKEVFQISRYKYVPHNDLDQLAAAAAVQPLSVSVSVGTEWQFYAGGVYDGNCGDMVNHGVTLVGYGTDSGKDFWKVKNSWGSTWGEQGYIRMVKTNGTGTGKCFIADQAVYPYKN